MARVFRHNFGDGSFGLWDTVSGGPAIAPGISGFSAYCANVGASFGASPLIKNIPASAELYFAFWFEALSHFGTILQVYAGANLLGQLCVDASSGLLQAKVNNTVVATGSKTLVVGSKYLLEVHFKIADSGGVIQVNVDGLGLDIDYLGDTKPGADTTIDQFVFTNDSGAGYYLGCVRVDDAGWIGDTRMQPLLVAGPGASTQLSPSSGANYACVAEVPAADADYVSGDAVGLLDLYATAPLTGAIASIVGLQLNARAMKEGSPTPQNIQLALRTGGTNYFSPDLAPPATTPKSLYNLWELNPNTGVLWTVDDFSAPLEIGAKLTA